MIGFTSIEFLEHTVKDGMLAPNLEKVQDIFRAKQPETKKQIMSFLGIVGFYRKFAPNFAEKAFPLKNFIREGNPTRFMRWVQPFTTISFQDHGH